MICTVWYEISVTATMGCVKISQTEIGVFSFKLDTTADQLKDKKVVILKDLFLF